MDNKLLENCIMGEELWIERSVIFLWRQGGLSALKKSYSPLFMKDDLDDEYSQKG